MHSQNLTHLREMIDDVTRKRGSSQLLHFGHAPSNVSTVQLLFRPYPPRANLHDACVSRALARHVDHYGVLTIVHEAHSCLTRPFRQNTRSASYRRAAFCRSVSCLLIRFRDPPTRGHRTHRMLCLPSLDAQWRPHSKKHPHLGTTDEPTGNRKSTYADGWRIHRCAWHAARLKWSYWRSEYASLVQEAGQLKQCCLAGSTCSKRGVFLYDTGEDSISQKGFFCFFLVAKVSCEIQQLPHILSARATKNKENNV
jgi:hypothetical protein